MMMMSSEPWYANPIVACISTILGLVGGGAAIIQLVLWAIAFVKSLREKRKKRAKQVRDELEMVETRVEEIAEGSFEEPQVDYKDAPGEINESITDAINQKLYESPPDFNLPADQIAANYEALALDAAKTALHGYLSESIMPDIRKSMQKFSVLPNFDTFVDTFSRRVVADLVTSKISQFQVDSFKLAVLGPVIQQRKDFFHNNYQAAEDHLDSMENAYRTSETARKAKQQELDDLVATIAEYRKEGKEEEAAKEEKRKEGLEEEVKAAEEEMQKKKQARDDAESERDEARRHKEAAENEAENDKSTEDWTKETERVFGE